jgi:hypothetical protein
VPGRRYRPRLDAGNVGGQARRLDAGQVGGVTFAGLHLAEDELSEVGAEWRLAAEPEVDHDESVAVVGDEEVCGARVP